MAGKKSGKNYLLWISLESSEGKCLGKQDRNELNSKNIFVFAAVDGSRQNIDHFRL